MVYGNHDYLGDDSTTADILGAQPSAKFSLGKHIIHVEHGNVLDRPAWWCMPCCCVCINKCFDKWWACCCCAEESKDTQLDYAKTYCRTNPKVDVVIMGHTHVQDIKIWDGENSGADLTPDTKSTSDTKSESNQSVAPNINLPPKRKCMLLNPGCATNVENQLGQIDLTLDSETGGLHAEASTVYLDANNVRVVPNEELSATIP
jgi:predicted phosphodiesterase